MSSKFVATHAERILPHQQGYHPLHNVQTTKEEGLNNGDTPPLVEKNHRIYRGLPLNSSDHYY